MRVSCRLWKRDTHICTPLQKQTFWLSIAFTSRSAWALRTLNLARLNDNSRIDYPFSIRIILIKMTSYLLPSTRYVYECSTGKHKHHVRGRGELDRLALPIVPGLVAAYCAPYRNGGCAASCQPLHQHIPRTISNVQHATGCMLFNSREQQHWLCLNCSHVALTRMTC